MNAAPDRELLRLPLFSWAEERHIVSPRSGKKLPRWGSIELACEILDGCDRETMYLLIKAGSVAAYKRRPDRKNSPYRVDLLSVWHHKHHQLPEGLVS